jgi:hypothetical protein
MTKAEGALVVVLLFAVFLFAILVALAARQSRAERITMLTAFASRARDTGRTLVGHGVDMAERTVANLAADPRNTVRIDQLVPVCGLGADVDIDENPRN